MRRNHDPLARTLVVLTLAASLYGLALVFSATRYDPALHAAPFKQAVALGGGAVLCLLLRAVDLRWVLDRGWWALAGLNVALLLLLVPLGNDDGTGNKSWIALPGGLFNLQPAEVGKVVFILLLSLQLDRLGRKGLDRPRAVLALAAHALGLTGLLYAVSGDMGMALVYFSVYFVMLWTAGVHPLWVLGQLAAGVGAVALLWPRLPEYVRLRFLVVLDHDLDPLGKGFQQGRSLLAIGSGQLTGQGYLRGTQTQSESASALPARHTDFIFSVAGEELGLLGCLFVLGLLTGILVCLVRLARRGDPLLTHVALGVAAMLGAQMALNVGMCLYAAPVVGVTLPLFSYGGSSLLSTWGAVGCVLSLAREQRPQRRDHLAEFS